MNAIKRIKALTGRNIKEILRDPLSLIFLYALPLLMLVLFYYLFSSQTDQFRMEYLAPAMGAFANSFLTLFLGLLIATDRGSSFIVRLYTTRIRSYEFILAYAAAMVPIGISQTALMLLAAGVIDTAFFGIGILWGILAGIPVVLLFIGFGLLLGSLCNEKSVGGVSSAVVMGQSILSGMWFPVEGMSESFIRVLNALPFRSASELMQNAVMGAGSIGKPLLVLLAYAAAITVISIFFYQRKMRA